MPSDQSESTFQQYYGQKYITIPKNLYYDAQ